jgi:hypothetical protein
MTMLFDFFKKKAVVAEPVVAAKKGAVVTKAAPAKFSPKKAVVAKVETKRMGSAVSLFSWLPKCPFNYLF